MSNFKSRFSAIIRLKRKFMRGIEPFLDCVSAYYYWLLPARQSYSQHGEDRLVMEDISAEELDGSVYIDIGCNHPMRLSNTYLLYRKCKAHGITVDPNSFFRRLYSRFRPRDRFICMGVAGKAGLCPFVHHDISNVFSGLDQESKGGGNEFVPVLPLDALMTITAGKPVMLLSIDCEGMELQVLESGPGILEKTRRIIVETGDVESASRIHELLTGTGFKRTHKTVYNHIYSK